MDYATMLGLSPAFGLGQEVGTDVAMQQAVASPEGVGATKSPLGFTPEQLALLSKMGASGQGPAYPAPGAPAPRVPHMGALTPLPIPQALPAKRLPLSKLIYGAN
jgi:hypothetical protein